MQMNKSILILISNFLLLSLLALAWFDETEAETPARTGAGITAEAVASPEQEMINALKSSLEQERQAGQRLDELLRHTQSSLQTNQATLVEREQQIHQTEKKLTRQEEEGRQLAAAQTLLQEKLDLSRKELAKLQQENEGHQKKVTALQRLQTTMQANLDTLERRYASAQTELADVQNRYKSSVQEIDALQQKLALAETEARVNEQLLEELEQELRQRIQGTGARPQTVAPRDPQQKTASAEKQKGPAQVQPAEIERQPARQQPDAIPKTLEISRQEKAVIREPATKPVENASLPATPAGALKAEAQPSLPSTIFSEFTSNQLQSVFLASRSGLFGKAVEKSATVPTILFSDGKQTYVVHHVRETPFEFTADGTEWERMTVTLQRGKAVQPLTTLGFLDQDPRILIAPVTDQQAAQMQCRIYPVAKELLQSGQAIIVRPKENQYGECFFQSDAQSSGYMRLQREGSGRLSGKSVPSSGDLVFSKTGDVIGIMVNSEFCLVFDRLKTTRTIALGNKVPKQLTAAYLSQMYFQLEDLPSRLR